jgi:arsenite methyltransferase
VRHLADKIKSTHTPPDEHPLTNFDERDLLRLAEEAGFRQVKLTYTAELAPWPLDTTDWHVLMAMSGNPLDPTVGAEIAAALTPAERAEFEAHLRPLVESGAPREGRTAAAYLSAIR